MTTPERSIVTCPDCNGTFESGSGHACPRPTRFVDASGRFSILGPVDEPGFKGYKLYDGGEHVATCHRLRDAKAEAETRALDREPTAPDAEDAFARRIREDDNFAARAAEAYRQGC